IGTLPLLIASMAIAEITPLVPGAGPPPTRIPTLLGAIRSSPAEVAKSVSELVHSHIPGRRHLLNPRRVFEILRLEANHIFSSDAISFALNVYQPHACFAGLRLANLVKGHRNHASALNADHRVSSSFAEESDCTVTKISTVSRVEWNRICATQFIADVLV